MFIELSLLNLGTYLLFCLNHSTVIHVLVVYYANCLSRKTILTREGQRVRLAMSLSKYTPKTTEVKRSIEADIINTAPMITHAPLSWDQCLPNKSLI